MASSLQTYLSAKKMGVGAQASVSHPKRSKSISSLHATAAAPAASDHRHHQKTASASKSHYPLEERQGRGGGGWEEEEHVNNSSRFVYEDDQEIISSATGFFSQKPIKRTYSFHHKHRMVEEPQDEESSSYGGHDSAFASSDSLAANDHKPSGILYSGSRNLNGSSGYMIDGQYVRPHSQDIAREGWIWIHNTTSWKHCYGVATYYNSTPMFQLYADAESPKPFKVFQLRQCVQIISQSVASNTTYTDDLYQNYLYSNNFCNNSSSADSPRTLHKFKLVMTNGGYDILVGVDSSDECIGWVSAMKIMVNDQESSSAGRFNNNNRNEAIPSSVELQEKASKLAIDSPIRSSVQLHTSGSHTAGGFDMEDLVSKIILGLKNSVANGGNHDDKWTLEQIGNSLIDLTDSMEMRTSKIAKMVNQIVASSSSSSSSVQEVSTVNNSALPSGLVQDEILHICKAIESRMNQSNSSVSSEVYCSSSPSFLQASIDSISNDIKLGLNKLHENLDSLDQSQDTKLIEIKTAIMSHLDSFSANQAISAASAATLESNGKRTELLLVSKLDEIQKTVVSALEHVSNTDDEESSGTVINAKLDNINEIVNFVSKAQCKLVDLMAAAGNGGGNSSSGASSSRQSTSPSKTSSSSPSSVEEKRFKILNDNLESLHKRVQDGTEEVTELIEAVMNGSLEPLQKKVTIALGDECEAIERKLSEGQFNQEAMIRNLFNVMDIKLEDSFAKVEDVVSAITKRLVEIHQTKMMMAEEEEKEKEARVVTGSDGELASILTLLQQISSKINITSSSPSQIPNNSMLLSLNEKIISLTKLTEQIKESQASRFSTMDEKLRLFTSIGGGGGGGGSINNSLVKSSIISGQEVDASVDGNVAVSAETIQSNLMDVATKVSRIQVESESNHNLNQGWFTRIHDLLKHVHIQGSETAAAYSTASSASSAKSTASQDVIIDGMTGVQASMVAMTSSLDVIQTAVTDESIPFHLSKLLKLATTTDRAVSSAGVIGEGVERLVKYASKADDEVAGVRTEVFKLCERFAQIEAVVQNMPENTEAELKAIAKSIEVLMMKNGDGGIVSDAQQQHQLQQQSSSTTTTTTPPPLQKQQLADIHRLVESTYSTLISNLPSNSLFGDISSNPFSSTSSSSSPSIEMEQNISQILSLLTEMKNRSFGGGMGMTRSNSNVGSLVNNFENKQQQQLINTTATPSPDLQKMIKQVISHHEELGRRDLETRGALDSIQHTLSILVENSGANASNISNSNHRSSSSDDNNNYSSNVARGERAVVDVSAELGQVKDILSEIREFARAGMKKNTTTTTSKNEMVDVLSDKRSNLQDEILMLEKRRASLQKEIEELEETKRRGGVVASRVFSLQKQSSQISLDSVDNSSLSGGAGSGAAGNRRPLPRIPSHKSVGGNSNSGVLSRNNSSNTHLPPQPPMLLNLDLSSDAIFGGTSN